MALTEKIILKNDDFFAKSLNIGITSSDIIDKINAFDWLDLTEATSLERYAEIMFSIFDLFTFKYPKKYDAIVKKAFTSLFVAVSYTHLTLPTNREV